MASSDKDAFVLKTLSSQRGVYKVTSKRRLDREQFQKKRFEVLVQFQLECKDGGTSPHTITSTGEVVLRDINDNAPVIHNVRPNVSLLEDTAPQRRRQFYRVLQVSQQVVRVELRGLRNLFIEIDYLCFSSDTHN